MCVESSGVKRGRKKKKMREEKLGGRRVGAGADFNPVASGLRQFGFQPRLESQRPASQTNLNRNRDGKSLSEGCGPPFSASSPFRRRSPGRRSVVFSVRESLRLSSGKRTELESFPFSTSDRARSKKMAPIATSREEFGKQVSQLITAVVLWILWVGCVFCFPPSPSGMLHIYLLDSSSKRKRTIHG